MPPLQRDRGRNGCGLFGFSGSPRTGNGWICPSTTSNIRPVNEIKLTDREMQQAKRIGKGSPLAEALAANGFFLRKFNKDLPKEIRYRSHEEFVVKFGRTYTPRPFPAKYRKWEGEPQACLYNAADLALAFPDLEYAEGFALHADPRIDYPVEHAWCVDPKGNVIDPTWHEKVGREYFGVALDKWLLAEQHQSKLPFGLMFNWNLLEDVMCGKAKGWKKMLAKRPVASPKGKVPS